MNCTQKANIAFILGSALLFALMVGCSEDIESTESPDFGPVIDSTIVITPNGDTVVKLDTIDKIQDTIKTIDENGDTLYVIDTIYLNRDTTLRWIGNSALVITEILPVNVDFADEEGDDGAWVEIYNAGTEVANLKGYSLVENLAKPKKWTFGNELIAPKSFRVVFCDNKDIAEATGSDGNITVEDKTVFAHARTHTNWKMDKEGGTIYLIDRNYGIRDSVPYPYLEPGVSWGIMDGGIWKYFGTPTPEKKNIEATAFDQMAPSVNLDAVKSGFYNDAITINPPNYNDGTKIRCTQDGTAPTSSSEEFNAPMNISKNTTLRCAAYKEGTLTKKIVTKNFFIGETVKMPVVALSVDPEFFRKHYIKGEWSSPNSAPAGLYEDIEYPVNVEYFEKGSSTEGATWNIDAGISIMGGYSRLQDKKSVSIVMREQYQDGWLHYSLFETRKKADDKYKGFNLRNNGNRFVSDYIADAMGGAMLEGSGVDYQRSRQVVVFYNGEYYGIHDMRERFNKNFVESNYGIEASTVNMVKHLGDDIDVSNGTADNYQALLNFVGTNDFSGVSNANYATLKTLMDVGNFADYMAAEIYAHNGDWPNNNVRAWRSPEQSWKFMVYDLDHGYDWTWGVNNGEFSQHTDIFPWIKKGGGNHPCKSTGCFANLYIKLIENPDFKRLFINRSAVMLNNYLTSTNGARVIDEMIASIDPDEITRDLSKYHQDEKYYSNSCGTGFSKTGSCLKSWLADRDISVRADYMFEFGLSNEITVNIKSNGSGIVLMEGMNLPGSTTSSTNYSGKFFGGVAMELFAVPSGGAMFVGWSDGVADNPRIVNPVEGASYTANFQ